MRGQRVMQVVTAWRGHGRWLLVAAAAVFSWAAFGLGTHPSDLAVFLRAGDAVLNGADPYTPVDSPALVDGHAFVYPWLSAWLFVPLAVLPLGAAEFLFFAVSVASVVAGCRLLGAKPGLVAAAVLLSSFFSRNVELGAVNAVFFFLIAALWRWRDRDAVVAIGMMLLVGTKLFLAPLVLWVLLTRTLRCSALTLGALAAFFGLSFALGPISVTNYVESMSRLSDYMSLRGMSFLHAWTNLFPGLPARPAVLAVAASLVAGFAISHIRRPSADGRPLFIACLLTALLLTPIMWVHYGVLFLAVVLLVRPTVPWTVAASLASWVIASTEGIKPLGDLPLSTRFALLYGLVAALPILTAWDQWRGPATPTPDREIAAAATAPSSG